MADPKVRVGDKAPDFSLMDYKGKTHTLHQYKGKKVWLAFFRYAACPVCNLRVDQMRAWCEVIKPEKVDLQILAVFQSTVMTMTNYVGRQNPPFPLLCDPTEALYFEYGLGWGGSVFNPNVIAKSIQAAGKGYLVGPKEGRANRLPGDFLIDTHGVVRKIHMGKDWTDNIPLEEVEDFLSGS